MESNNATPDDSPHGDPRDAILVLLDVVGYTPQSRAAGGVATREFDRHFTDELRQRAEPHGFHFIKPIGDAALLWGESPRGLVGLIQTLFKDDPIPPHAGIMPRLRMLAHKDYFVFTHDADGSVTDVHGLEGIVLFRLEKAAHINRVIVTPHLFHGVRPLLAGAGVTFRAVEMPQELKGVGPDSPRQIYLLTPPLAEETRGQELPQPYRAARDALKDDVQFIPVFGQLYDPIPMGENFLNLTLDLRRTAGPAGYYRWLRPELDWERRAEIGRRGKEPADELSNKAFDAELDTLQSSDFDEPPRRLDLDRLSADDLLANFPAAVIAGLPGAGKTTILRHFAWRALEDNRHAVVVFVEARNLDVALVTTGAKPKRTKRGRAKAESPAATTIPPEWLELDNIFRVIATLFLCPGQDRAALTDRQTAAIAETAAALREAWETDRAILLLDALDEAPTRQLRHWLAAAANRLMQRLAPPDAAADFDQPAKLPAGRCFLSLRAAELEGQDAVALSRAPVCLVNALDQEQIREIARRRLGEDSPLYARFDDAIWRSDHVVRIAGTPLTAMLIVFFFEVHQRFERRFATYRLLVYFVLDRAWQKIKTGTFAGAGQGLNTFFVEVLRDTFLAEHPEIDLPSRALAHVARRLLFYQRAESKSRGASPGEGVEAVERAISLVELREQLDDWVTADRAARPQVWRQLVDREAGDPKAWLDAWRRENILLPSGRDHVVFLHSTVLEFLAAVDLGRAVGQRSTAGEDLARVFDNRSRDSLDVLPILCSSQHETAWTVLRRLGSGARKAAGKFPPQSTLPLRCLAETEAAERDRLELFRDVDRHRREQQQIDARREKAWAYEHVRDMILRPPGDDEPHQIAWLDARLEDLERLTPLCRDVLLTQYLAGWKNDGTPLAKKQAELLRRMLHEELCDRFAKRLGVTVVVSNRKKADKLLDGYRDLLVQFRGEEVAARWSEQHQQLAAGGNGDELTLDRPGDGKDRNLAYYQVAFSPAITGLFGSPNLRHAGAVCGLAISPDGRLVVSASDDCSLILWDIATGRELRRLEGHKGSVTTCAFSPDASLIVSGSADHTLKLLDAASGKEIRGLEGHKGSVTTCAFSPDGSLIVGGTYDNTLKLWDSASGKEVRGLEGHKGFVWACAFSPDGSLIVSGSDDETLKLWDVASGNEVRGLEGHIGTVWACAFSPDASMIVSGSADRTLKLWDAATGKEVRGLAGHKNVVYACAFSPDASLIVSGSSDKTLKLWDAASGKEVRTLEGHKRPVRTCAFSPDGSLIVSGSFDKTLKIWDAASGEEVRGLEGHKGSVWACAFSPDTSLIVSGSFDHTLKLWDAASGKEICGLEGHKGPVCACAFSPDASLIVSGSADKTLKLWDIASGKEVRGLAGHENVVYACAFSPDASLIVSGSADKTLKLWDAASGKEVRTLKGHKDFVRTCAFSPDASMIVSGSDDKTLKLWDAASGKEVCGLEGHKHHVYACAFSPDASLIVSGSGDKTLKLWDAASGKEVHGLVGHKDSVYACAFIADASLIVSGSYDKTLKLWDAATGEQIGSWTIGWPIRDLSIHPTQPHLVVVALANGTLALVDTSIKS